MAQAIAANGTKVWRNRDGTVVLVPPGVNYAPEPFAMRVALVRDVTLRFPCGGAIEATIDLFPSQDAIINARPEYRFIAADGKPKEIRSITFDDGSIWHAANWPRTQIEGQEGK